MTSYTLVWDPVIKRLKFPPIWCALLMMPYVKGFAIRDSPAGARRNVLRRIKRSRRQKGVLQRAAWLCRESITTQSERLLATQSQKHLFSLINGWRTEQLTQLFSQTLRLDKQIKPATVAHWTLDESFIFIKWQLLFTHYGWRRNKGASKRKWKEEQLH